MHSNYAQTKRVPLLAVFTLEDKQIVWTDKLSQTNELSDVQTGRTNFSTNKSSDICPSAEKMIFPRRLIARWDEQVAAVRQIHFRRSNDWFSPRREMGLATEQGFMWSFNMADIKKKSVRSAKSKVKCLNRTKHCQLEEELTTFAHVLLTCIKIKSELNPKLLHKLVLLSFLIQEVDTWVPSTR